jgi:hypothetical protein
MLEINPFLNLPSLSVDRGTSTAAKERSIAYMVQDRHSKCCHQAINAE